jgi:hypothetical protein
MKMKYFLIPAIFLLIKCGKPELLTMTRVPYVGDKLKVNGYYYTIVNDGLNDTLLESLFLYRNGVALFLGAYSNATLFEFENEISNLDVKNLQRLPYNWGIFRIEDSEIKINRWLIGTGSNYPNIIANGTILSDTSFMIKGLFERRPEEKHIFYLKEYSPKPDSTNNFIR